jgi:NADH-quinone oxidoreductase subunit A
MSPALSGSLAIVAYLALFAGTGFAFVFVNLLIGRFLRADNPNEEKSEVYECGEPAIGSSFVQFDLRFYVVALIFIIFDVEVAFLFPWATVFGKATHLQQTAAVATAGDLPDSTQAIYSAQAIYTELGVRDVSSVAGMSPEAIHNGAQQLLALATVEVLFFFIVLLIAFAYEWKLGALDWVRALADEYSQKTQSGLPPPTESEPSLSA